MSKIAVVRYSASTDQYNFQLENGQYRTLLGLIGSQEKVLADVKSGKCAVVLAMTDATVGEELTAKFNEYSAMEAESIRDWQIIYTTKESV